MYPIAIRQRRWPPSSHIPESPSPHASVNNQKRAVERISYYKVWGSGGSANKLKYWSRWWSGSRESMLLVLNDATRCCRCRYSMPVLHAFNARFLFTQSQEAKQSIQSIIPRRMELESTALPILAITGTTITAFWLGRTTGLVELDGTPTGGLFGTAVVTMGILRTAAYVLTLLHQIHIINSASNQRTLFLLWLGSGSANSR